MLKTVQCVIAALLIYSSSFAQKKIIVQGTKDEAFFLHVVKKGESLTSISKQFGTDVASVMRINAMNNKSKMVFGKPIKIPFNPAILDQSANAASLPTAIVHKVAKGENLYRISLNHNKVDLELLKKWNKLATNAIVDEGQEIIVGYVNMKAIPTDVAKKDVPVVTDPKPAVKEPAKEVVKEETRPVSNAAANEVKQEVKKEEPIISNAVKQEPVIDTQNIGAEGFFAGSFGKDVEGRELKTVTGTSMTFKTASGWTDKKYYILINDVPPGSIVKVSNGGSKYVYAKVLWNLGGIKENEGLDFRISNAAAAALGISDPKFPLIVTFYE